MKCKVCKNEAVVALRSHNTGFCEKCYRDYFRRQLTRGIESQHLFTREEKLLVAISGGKDSLALMLELVELGYNATALFIDLAIPGSSDLARQKVIDFCMSHQLQLEILDIAREGLAIPKVKAATTRPICSVCGKIKRHYFNRAAVTGKYDALATGHNLDDEVGRLLSNTLRWDTAYLADQGPLLPAENGFARRVKPLWRLTEFETANYAFLRGINYHCAACPYSIGASFTELKKWMQALELKMPGRKLDFYLGFLSKGKNAFRETRDIGKAELHPCEECGMPTSAEDICSICRMKKVVNQ